MQIGITWNNAELTLYIDGTKIQSVSQGQATENIKEIILGIPYSSWACLGDEKTAIDELMIFSDYLDEKQIGALYAAASQNLKVKNSTMQNKTPYERPKTKIEPMDVKNMNLMHKDAGTWIISSSFGDYTKKYEDNLIDGNPETVWQPMENEYPVYLELRWVYPRKINSMSFIKQAGADIQAASVLLWDRQTSKWRKIKDLSQDELKDGKVVFPEINADRLRFIIEKADGKVTLSELQAYGPPQAIPGLVERYWDAWYVWYPEPDQNYKADQPRYFRRTFDIEDAGFVSAFVQARSNDYYRIWVNGSEVCSGSVAIKPSDVTRLLKKGRNVIAAEAELARAPGQWGWGELIIELSINYRSNSQRIGTGPEWKSFDSKPAGWNSIDFDDSGWKGVYCYTRPPDGPWGKIDYYCTSCRESMEVKNVKIDSAVLSPGGVVNAEIIISAEKSLKDDYFLIIGLSTPGSKFGNYSVSQDVISMPSVKNADGNFAVSAQLPLPPYAPSGKLQLTLKAFNSKNGFEVNLKNIKDNEIGNVQIEARQSDFKGKGNAEIAYTNGQASFVIDGKVSTPFFLRYLQSFDLERAYNLDKYSGIKIHYFIIYGSQRVIDVNKDAREFSLRNLDQKITALLAECPDIYLILAVDLRPTQEWLKQNPGERLVDAFGEPSVISFSSLKYEQECRDFLKTMIDFLKEKPYWTHIIGFHPWSCGVPDSAMGGVGKNTWQTDRSKITAGDFNPQAIGLFREFLRRKYKNTPDNLKKAWKKSDVTFENAMPVISEIVAEGKDGGVFRDPSEGMMTFDYAEFLPTIYGNYLRRICRFVKEQTDWKKMTFEHYGYVVEHMRALNTPGGQLNNNNFDLSDFLNDPAIDGYVGAFDYGHRLAGTPVITYFPWSSFRLHGRMYLPDDDQRYYVAGTKDHGRCHSIRETRAIMQRNIGSDITRNFGSWFADMSTGKDRSAVSWTGEKEIARMLGEMNDIYKKAIDTGYESASEIAVVFNFDSLKYLDVFYGPTLNNNIVTWMYYSEFFKMGAPFDVYMFSDLKHPNIRKDYKLYVMMNPYCLSADDLKVIDSLKRDGKTILWLYAPGYVDLKKGLVTDNISSITGIKVEKISGKEKMSSRLSKSSHVLTQGLEPDYEFSAMGFSYPATVKMHPSEFSPCFRIVDDKADIIAKFSDGKGSIAARDFNTWKSIYSVIPRLDVAFLRNVCRWAGVHIYTDTPIVFDANRNFIVLHNGYKKERTVKVSLPEKMDIYDAVSNKLIMKQSLHMEVFMEPCSTRILFLN